MEFVGHGAFGVMSKASWLPYYTALGFSEAWGWRLMPVVGWTDIALGFIALLSPRPALIAWMGFWGLFTALLRPLAGESGFETLERTYNYGVPLLMLYYHWAPFKGWWRDVSTAPSSLSRGRVDAVLLGLRLITAGMLVGHGAYGAFVGKANLLRFYDAAGLAAFGSLASVSRMIGAAEIALGLGSLFADAPAYFALVFAVKLGAELLYPLAGANGAWFEVLERGGAYVAPLMFVALKASGRPAPLPRGSSTAAAGG